MVTSFFAMRVYQALLCIWGESVGEEAFATPFLRVRGEEEVRATRTGGGCNAGGACSPLPHTAIQADA